MNTYTSAQSRITLDATGVYLTEGDDSVLINGVVTLNAVDGRLNSITVADRSTGKAVRRIKGRQVQAVAGLSFPTRRDTATLAGFVR